MQYIHILVKAGCGERDGEEVTCTCVCNKVLKVCTLKEVVGCDVGRGVQLHLNTSCTYKYILQEHNQVEFVCVL